MKFFNLLTAALILSPLNALADVGGYLACVGMENVSSTVGVELNIKTEEDDAVPSLPKMVSAWNHQNGETLQLLSDVSTAPVLKGKKWVMTFPTPDEKDAFHGTPVKTTLEIELPKDFWSITPGPGQALKGYPAIGRRTYLGKDSVKPTVFSFELRCLNSPF